MDSPVQSGSSGTITRRDARTFIGVFTKRRTSHRTVFLRPRVTRAPRTQSCVVEISIDVIEANIPRLQLFGRLLNDVTPGDPMEKIQSAMPTNRFIRDSSSSDQSAR